MAQDRTPQEALAALYALYDAYVHNTLTHLDTQHWQAEGAFRDQAYEALRALVSVVHGPHHEGREFGTLCGVCHLYYARRCQHIPGRTELFYCDACWQQLPTPKEETGVPWSASPKSTTSYPVL